MAKQSGIIKLKGTIGGVSFYKSQDGYLAREKGGVERERIMSDPAFARTRENGQEFGTAGKAVKFLTSAFRPVILSAADGRVTSRLIAQMLKVVQSDAVHERGQRTVADGDLAILKGFEFNNRSKLSSTLYAPFTHAVNRVDGEITVNIPAFVPRNGIVAPAGTTHFSITVVGCELDFVNATFIQNIQQTAILPYDSVEGAATELTVALSPASTQPMFLVMGIQFYQNVNNVKYPLKNGSFNAVQLIEVDY